jgi:hypothetical protein
MKNVKRKIAAIIAAATMGVSIIGGTCMSASATSYDSYGKIVVEATQSALYNTSGQSRYSQVIHNVYNRNTGARVTYASNSGTTISQGSPLIASKSAYNNSNVYYYVGSGTLYNGSSSYTGAFKTYSKTVK